MESPPSRVWDGQVYWLTDHDLFRISDVAGHHVDPGDMGQQCFSPRAPLALGVRDHEAALSPCPVD